MEQTESFSPYAPVRYRGHAWWNFARKAAQEGMVLANGQMLSSFPSRIMQDLCVPMMQAANSELASHPEGASIEMEFAARVLDFRHWVPLAAQYDLCGRQIFDLTDELVEMLAKTDIGECTLEDWHTPYDAFFVRFGKREDMKLPFDEGTFEYLDGAFVAITPWNGLEDPERRIKFGFTTVHEDGSGVDMPGYFLDLTPEEQKLPIMDGIAASIKRRVADMATPDDSDWARSLNATRGRMIEEGMELMRQSIALLVNALFYIESLGADAKEMALEPGRDTPPEQTVTWMQAHPQRRQKLKSKLTSDGYVLVRLIGKEIRPSPGSRSGVPVKTHWRRGHWREQRHGPGYSQVRRVWIKPTIVNEGTPHDDMPGRIYGVGGDSVH